MSTSGSTDYGLTALGVVTEAFDICGIGAEGEALSTDMIDRAMRSLNLIIKAWSAHQHLWLKTEGSVTLVSSQASYALASLFSVKPMRVISVRRQLTSGAIDTPLTELSHQEYFDQPNKTSLGVPVQFYYDPQVSTGTLYVWPTPDATTAGANTLKVTWLRKIEDFDATSNDPDLPQEWLQALSYALAEQLALKYGIDRAVRQEIAGRALGYFTALDSWDTEPASLFLQPDGMWWNGQA